MIIDKIDNILFYKKILPNLESAIDILKQIKSFEECRNNFYGGYYMIQKGKTKPMYEGNFEVHRKYIDLQIIVEGSEEIAWSDIKDLESVVDYDNLRDVERLDGNKQNHMLISKNMFYIAFPHDAHKAVSHTKESHSYTKIVIKLEI